MFVVTLISEPYARHLIYKYSLQCVRVESLENHHSSRVGKNVTLTLSLSLVVHSSLLTHLHIRYRSKARTTDRVTVRN